MDWINVNDRLPDVKASRNIDEYYESDLLLVAFKSSNMVFYEVAKYTKGRDSKEEEFWGNWYVPQADDVVINVVAWMPFKPFM